MMEPTFEWSQAQPQDVVNSMGGSLQNASVQVSFFLSLFFERDVFNKAVIRNQSPARFNGY